MTSMSVATITRLLTVSFERFPLSFVSSLADPKADDPSVQRTARLFKLNINSMKGKFRPTLPPRRVAPKTADSASDATTSRSSEDNRDESRQIEDGRSQSSSFPPQKDVESTAATRKKRIAPNLTSVAERKRARNDGVACVSENGDGTFGETPSAAAEQQSEEANATSERSGDGLVLPQKKRQRRMNSTSEMPADRSKMTMRDLIYHNPRANPMKRRLESEKQKKRKATTIEEVTVSLVSGERETEEDDGLLVPQVKVGPDGSIIIDQASLTVSPTKQQPIEELADTKVVYEDSVHITAASYRRRTVARAWTKEETGRFYDALSRMGTDFGLMTSLFPNRTRKQIKAKFKREEKVNCARVNEAIRRNVPMNEATFEGDEDGLIGLEEEESQ
eukprot:m.2192 g.2192  ORF g.2192 m.2192 type:complete len:391 (+) comp8425_c0_seq1:748-1920(+)